MLLPPQTEPLLRLLQDPILDNAVIYASDIPFRHNEREGRYTEFVGNPTGTTFVANSGIKKFC